jgi:signal transduction histidine kinase
MRSPGVVTAEQELGADPHSRPASARLAVALVAAACLLITVILNAFPEAVPVSHNRSLHVALETVAALVLLLVASVLGGRYRRSASARDLLALLALGVLAANNLFVSVLTAVLTTHPNDFTTWISHGTYVLGPVLLAAAALAPSAPLRRRRRMELLAVTGTAVILAAIVIVAASLGSELPGQFALPPTDRESLELLKQQPALTVLESFAALCFAIAAAALAQHADRERDAFQMWLALFAVIASVAFFNYAIFPTLYTELIYAGDILLLIADLVLLIGMTREIAMYQDAVAQAAVLDERRRLARDLHDGVAQELAFIASQLRWSAGEPPDAREMDHILESVERALDESRGAIAALSRSVDEPLHLALAHTAMDVAERLGGRVELELDHELQVPAPWREALGRIVREAVANAIRHGHARTVRVEFQGQANGTSLKISDDGEGFDLSQPHSPSSFGLISMQERTESLGGEFKLSSEPGAGTSVEVRIPDHSRRPFTNLNAR